MAATSRGSNGALKISRFLLCLILPLLYQSFVATSPSAKEDPVLSLSLQANSVESMTIAVSRGKISQTVANNLKSCVVLVLPSDADAVQLEHFDVKSLPFTYVYGFPKDDENTADSTESGTPTPSNTVHKSSTTSYKAWSVCTFKSLDESDDYEFNTNSINVIPGVTEPNYVGDIMSNNRDNSGISTPVTFEDNSLWTLLLAAVVFSVIVIVVIAVVVFFGRKYGSFCSNEPSVSQTELNTQDAIEELRAYVREQKAQQRNHTGV